MARKKSSNWGGVRPGSGPKVKVNGGGVTMAFVLSHRDLDFVDAWKKREKVSRSEALRQIIEVARAARGG